MAKTKPNTDYRIITLDIAVEDTADIDTVTDELNHLLGDLGEDNPKSAIVEWRVNSARWGKVSHPNPKGGEIFKEIPRPIGK